MKGKLGINETIPIGAQRMGMSFDGTKNHCYKCRFCGKWILKKNRNEHQKGCVVVK